MPSPEPSERAPGPEPLGQPAAQTTVVAWCGAFLCIGPLAILSNNHVAAGSALVPTDPTQSRPFSKAVGLDW